MLNDPLLFSSVLGDGLFYDKWNILLISGINQYMYRMTKQNLTQRSALHHLKLKYELKVMMTKNSTNEIGLCKHKKTVKKTVM